VIGKSATQFVGRNSARRRARGTAYEAIRRGEIPSIRVGKRILVPRAKLHAMLGHNGSA
jgi:excisionase family DNA binding protein